MQLLDSIVDRLEINPNKHAATIKTHTLKYIWNSCNATEYEAIVSAPGIIY